MVLNSVISAINLGESIEITKLPRALERKSNRPQCNHNKPREFLTYKTEKMGKQVYDSKFRN